MKRNKYKKVKENTAEKKESAQSNECVVGNVEELYTAVQKKPKGTAAEGEVVAPSIPPHTLELYTAVVKKPKCNQAEDTPPLPPHTVEDLYTAVEKVLNNCYLLPHGCLSCGLQGHLCSSTHFVSVAP